MLRFDYAKGFLVTDHEKFDLDELRAYLLTTSRSLCNAHLIGTFYRPGVMVEDYTFELNGVTFRKREIDLSGQMVNTYDWNTIFFKAMKAGLIQNFINENSRHRESSTEAIAV